MNENNHADLERVAQAICNAASISHAAGAPLDDVDVWSLLTESDRKHWYKQATAVAEALLHTPEEAWDRCEQAWGHFLESVKDEPDAIARLIGFRDDYETGRRGPDLSADVPEVVQEAAREGVADYHACFTGDRPHGNANECVAALRDLIRQLEAEYMALRPENQTIA